MELTKEVISQYFHLTIMEAAKQLNVGLGTLQRFCRDVGFQRWPQRKLKSLDLLISNLQVRIQINQTFSFYDLLILSLTRQNHFLLMNRFNYRLKMKVEQLITTPM